MGNVTDLAAAVTHHRESAADVNEKKKRFTSPLLCQIVDDLPLKVSDGTHTHTCVAVCAVKVREAQSPNLVAFLGTSAC